MLPSGVPPARALKVRSGAMPRCQHSVQERAAGKQHWYPPMRSFDCARRLASLRMTNKEDHDGGLIPRSGITHRDVPDVAVKLFGARTDAHPLEYQRATERIIFGCHLPVRTEKSRSSARQRNGWTAERAQRLLTAGRTGPHRPGSSGRRHCRSRRSQPCTGRSSREYR